MRKFITLLVPCCDLEPGADYSLWAKDLVFVISDGHMDGMHAFLSAYHHSEQSSTYPLLVEVLCLTDTSFRSQG